MNGFRWRRAWSGMMILFCGGATALVASPAPRVTWFQMAPSCPVQTSDLVPGDGEVPQIISCGDAGSFAIGKPNLRYTGDCTPLDQGTEAPASLSAEATPPLPVGFPCAGGSCLGHTPGRPWVAALDWRTAHGWSVASTIREASDGQIGVELYDLADASAISQWVPSVSDLHVLLKLCAVAEAARANPADRPLALNLSFGRILTTATEMAGCSGGSLGCSVSQVLSRLAAQGIVPVAAAGNHHVLLFPAASPDVLSVGAFDLSRFQYRQEFRASMQTPAEAQALMLGYGLYLSAGKAGYWPAPPGSSYAAALLSGWLGGYLAGGGQLALPLPAGTHHWAPAPTANGLALALDGVPLPGSELDGPRRLLDRALGSPALFPVIGEGTAMTLTEDAPPLPELPVVYADNGNGPLPGVDPCLPCRGNGMQGESLESLETLTLDLSSSGALPPQMTLLAVFLRVGKRVYAFDNSRDSGLLSLVATGGAKSLTFYKVGGIFVEGEQPSLVLVIYVGGTSYWHEVPIDLPL